MRRAYKTEETGYTYYVSKTVDMAGNSYFAVVVPAPRQKIRRSCGKWANHKIIQECISDFGLDEEERKYKENGETVIYGF